MAQALHFQNSELDGEVHFLRSPDPYINGVLCYPSRACKCVEERLKMLLSNGFVYFLETGKNILGIRVLGRGYSAVTVVAYHVKYGIGALKILRTDSRRSSLVREAEMMKNAQPSGLPPNLYLYGDFYVFYELLPPHTCKSYARVLEELLLRGNLESLRSLLRNTLTSLYVLDSLKVDHTEMNRLHGHVFYCNGNVKILDWESARIAEKPTNLTSFISFLLYRFKYAENLRKALGYCMHKVLRSLREYKIAYSKEAFNGLLRSLLLD